MVAYLDGVRCLYNTDTESVIELVTDKFKKIVRLPYTVTILEKDRGNGNRYNYSNNVKSICKALNINTRDYFGIIHSDCI